MIGAIVCNVIGLAIGSMIVKVLTGESWQEAAKKWVFMVMGAISFWLPIYMRG